MALKISTTALEGVLVVECQAFADKRGFFLETYHQQKYTATGLDRKFVQDNHSRSAHRVLRGLHYQLKHPQGKLVYAARGRIFDVAVDIRLGSKTFGKWFGIELSDMNHKQLFIPEGFAHGFCTLSEAADVIYKCTELYDSGDDHGVLWNDQSINIDWPIKEPVISEKDAQLPQLKDLPDKLLPTY